MPAGRHQPACFVDDAAVFGGLDFLREQPFAAFTLVGLVADHALGKQPGERLVEIDVTALLQGAGEKSRIEEVKHGVLDAANILVYRHPVLDRVALEGDRRTRRAIPQKIPGRIKKGVERVGLAAGRPAAARALNVLPGRMAVERIARPVERDVAWQFNR